MVTMETDSRKHLKTVVFVASANSYSLGTSKSYTSVINHIILLYKMSIFVMFVLYDCEHEYLYYKKQCSMTCCPSQILDFLL